MRACRRYSVPPFSTVAHSVPRLPLKAAGGRTEVLVALWIWTVLHPMNSQQPSHEGGPLRVWLQCLVSFLCFCCRLKNAHHPPCYSGRGFLFFVPFIFWFCCSLFFLIPPLERSYISHLLCIPTGGTNWHALHFCSDISRFYLRG